MLCIKRYGRMTCVTIAGLDVPCLPVRISSPQDMFALSWHLLAWLPRGDGILCSFTNFITIPELSGPLYISPDIYHTQITEYLLEVILQHYGPKWALFFFLSASKVFLIAILLDIVQPAHPQSIVLTSGQTGPLGSTFPVLFRCIGFLIYSDQYIQTSLDVYVMTPENRSFNLKLWRLLLIGFRSVSANATDKPLRLKI